MRRQADELADYVNPSGSAKPPISSKRSSEGRRLGLAVATTVGVSLGILAIAGPKPAHRSPTPAEPTPSSTPAAAAGSSFPAAPSESVWADQPTAASYLPSYGFRYDTTRGFYGPVDATITRNGPGDYTVDLHHIAPPGGSAGINAYGGLSSCFSPRWGPDGSDEVIRVRCFTVRTQVPTDHIGPLTGPPTDSPFTVTFTQPTGAADLPAAAASEPLPTP